MDKDEEFVRAVINGEQWALEDLLERFSDLLDYFATRHEEQPDGTITETFDEDFRQELTSKLIEFAKSAKIEDYIK